MVFEVRGRVPPREPEQTITSRFRLDKQPSKKNKTMDNTNTQPKEHCQGCPYIEQSNTVCSLFRCTLWNKLISPGCTDSCIYKHYDKKGGQQ